MARNLAWALAAKTGLPYLYRKRHEHDCVILMYHAVVDGPRSYTRWTHVTASDFRWQIRWIKQRYRILPLSEVVQAIRNGRALPSKTAVITFDDGFRNNYTTAWPILKAEGVPATIFVTTGYLDSRRMNWSDQLFLDLQAAAPGELDLSAHGLGQHPIGSDASRSAVCDLVRRHVKTLPSATKNTILADISRFADRPGRRAVAEAPDFEPLTWDECREMATSGIVDFGAHTITHEILSRLPREAMRNEIEESCRIVRERLGVQDVPFAYPNGGRDDFDDHCKAVVQGANATCALTTIEGLCTRSSDVYALPRIGVGSDMTPSRFQVASSGIASGLKARLGRA
ncbi:MAG: polysaccharide deacetylase family protein [Planctomycetes bacterium]|nr:polysaccharide deacetylase family protein [Planctomycetota bacterium]